MDGMIGDADHMKIVTAPDPGHVVLGGEEMIIEPGERFRQLHLNGKSPLPRLSGNDDIEFHESASRYKPI
jgi:hypothetical protein